MRSTTFYLLFEGMLNVGAGNLKFILCYNHVKRTVKCWSLCVLVTCKTHIVVMLQFLTVFFLVVEVGQVMVVAKSNSHHPTRLNSATVRKW